MATLTKFYVVAYAGPSHLGGKGYLACDSYRKSYYVGRLEMAKRFWSEEEATKAIVNTAREWVEEWPTANVRSR